MLKDTIDCVITGAGGEVGNQLSTRLHRDNRSFEDYKKQSSRLHADSLIHLAARHPIDSVKHIVDANVVFLNQVLNQQLVTYDKFIFFSSTSVYGDKRVGHIKEAYTAKGIDTYGLTKCLGESLVKEAHHQSISLRCPAILEIRQTRNLLSKLFDQCLNNHAIKLTNADKPFNTFIDVESLYNIISQIQTTQLKGQAVNVAVKPDLSLSCIVEIMRDAIKSSSTVTVSDEDAPHYTLNTELLETTCNLKQPNVEKIIKKWCMERYEAQTY